MAQGAGAAQEPDSTLLQLASSLERLVAERSRELREREELLRAIVNTAVDAVVTIDQRGTIQSANPATERLFGFSNDELLGRNVNILMPSPYREQHDAYLARFHATGEKRIIGVGREALGQRKDGTIFPVELAVSEVGRQHLFTGIIRDITRRKELEREIVEIASLEQRRIGQDLHDTVSQELTALTLLTDDLAEALHTDPAATPILIQRIANGLRRTQRELRAVLRGLLPVAVDAEGLMAALGELVERTRQHGKVECVFDCPAPVAITDNVVATHLYLIAQEAVHNAVKHARPSRIAVSLHSAPALTLTMSDNGPGLSPDIRRPTPGTRGLGLRIMHNRAAIIGATLSFEVAEPNGTRVVCTLPRMNDAQEQ